MITTAAVLCLLTVCCAAFPPAHRAFLSHSSSWIQGLPPLSYSQLPRSSDATCPVLPPCSSGNRLPRRRCATQQQQLAAHRLDKGFNLLEISSAFLPQGAVVSTVSAAWRFAWTRMVAELAPQDQTGNYQRPTYTFSSWIGVDPQFPDQPGRYQLYVGNPCPWCHRTLLAVRLLGLDENAGPVAQMGITHLEDNPRKASRGGWIFSNRDPDRYFGGCRDLRQLYDALSPGYTGRCTAPLLVDKLSRRIVSNESADIVRMLNQVQLGRPSHPNRINLYPLEHAAAIDKANEWVYRMLNNGVYRCGFATTQVAYDRAAADVQDGLARCDAVLSQSPYLCGDQFTEADLRLLPTILRFDGAYAPLFRAGAAHLRIRDYPHLSAWLRRCWHTYPNIAETIDLGDACASYYRQLFPLNPGGIIPTLVTAESLGL